LYAPPRSSGAHAPLVVAAVAANLADGTLRLALPLIVLAQGATPSQAALLASAGVAPWFVMSLPVGAILDRAHPKRWCRRANLARAGALIAVATAPGEPPTIVWLVVALGLGAAEVVVDLGTQTLVPRVATPDQLPKLNAQLSGAQLATNQFLGPVLGGLTVAHTTRGTLVLAAALYLAAALALTRTTTATTPTGQLVSRWTHDLRAGLAYFRSRTDLVTLAAVVGALNLGEEITRSSLPAFGLDRAPLRLDETGLGLLTGLGGLGGLAGAALAPALVRRLGAARLVALAMPAIPATPIALTLAPTVPAVAAAIAASSAAVPLCAVAIITHRQRTIPTGLFGRTNATFQTIGLGAATLGGLAAAVSINLTSYRATFATAALIATTTILTLRPARTLATHQPPTTNEHAPRH
jgi:MFS family permease